MSWKKGEALTVAEMSRMGARARALKTTPEQRTAIARHAVRVRWERYRAMEPKKTPVAGFRAMRTTDKQRIVAELRATGASFTAIAEQVGVSPQRVQQILKAS